MTMHRTRPAPAPLRVLGVAALSIAALAAAPARAQGAREVPTVVGPIAGTTAANHPFNAAAYQAVPIDLASHGYVEEEYFVHGTANVYQYTSLATPTDRSVQVLRSGPYTNRILVRRPRDPSRFSGNVIVEQLNATNDYDLPIFWSYDHDYFLSRGDVWVGIDAKPVAIAGLKKFNSVRYAPLSWANPDPNQNATNCSVPLAADSSYATENGLLWDIFSQTATLLRSSGASNPLHGYDVRAIYGTGYSQSAINLVTYINAIEPTATAPGKASVFDGYFVGSGFGVQTTLNQCSAAPAAGDPRNVLRSRVAPIIATQSQTDYRYARQAYRSDSDAPTDRYRYEEDAGPAHVVVDQVVSAPDATDTHAAGGTTLTEDFTTCYAPGKLSTFPGHYLLDAAFAQLKGWVRYGIVPPHAPLIQATGTPPALVTTLDRFGNAVGGIRAPELDVPVAMYSESSGPSSLNCSLSGYEIDFGQTQLEAMYQTHDDYVSKVAIDALKVASKGFLTPDDAVESIVAAYGRQVP